VAVREKDINIAKFKCVWGFLGGLNTRLKLQKMLMMEMGFLLHRELVDHAGLSAQLVQWREHTFWPQANL
jgi:hypothetical protein